MPAQAVFSQVAQSTHSDRFTGPRAVVYLLLACCLALVACSKSPEQQDAGTVSDTVPFPTPRVVTSDVEPWGFLDDQGEMQGMLVDFQRSLFERAGLTYKNHLQPYPRVIHAVASGNADVAVMFKSPMADEVATSLGQVLSVPVVIVVLADNPHTFERLEDFAGMVVGQVRGSKYGPAFDNNSAFKRVSIPHVDQALRMLKAGRIDAMASTKQSLLFAMHATGFAGDQLRIALPLFDVSADLYVSHKAANAPWVAPLRDALAAMRADGTLTPSFYQSPFWPYFELCFAGQQCIATQ